MDIQHVLRTHVFLGNQYEFEFKVQNAVVGTGLAGGLDLNELLTVDEETILSLAAGGTQPNLSHGYIKAKVNFEVFGGISYLEFKQTEEYLRTSLQQRIWKRDGLTPLTVKLSIPQLEFATILAPQPPAQDVTITEALLSDSMSQSKDPTIGVDEGFYWFRWHGSCCCFPLLGPAFLQMRFATEMWDLEKQGNLPPSKMTPAKSLMKRWSLLLRRQRVVMKLARYQKKVAVASGGLAQKQSGTAQKALQDRALAAISDTPTTRKTTNFAERFRFVANRLKSASGMLEAPEQQHMRDKLPPPPETPPRIFGESTFAYYARTLQGTTKDDVKQWLRYSLGSVYFIPWILGQWDFSDRVNRMAVFTAEDLRQKVRTKAKEEAEKRQQTLQYAANLFLEDAMMREQARKKKNVELEDMSKGTRLAYSQSMALRDAESSEQPVASASSSGGMLAIGDVAPADDESVDRLPEQPAIRPMGTTYAQGKRIDEDDSQASSSLSGSDASSSVHTSQLSVDDNELLKKAQQAQWGRRWLLFANPQNRKYYWYNRDTKVIVNVNPKYITRDVKPPWEEDAHWQLGGQEFDPTKYNPNPNTDPTAGSSTDPGAGALPGMFDPPPDSMFPAPPPDSGIFGDLMGTTTEGEHNATAAAGRDVSPVRSGHIIIDPGSLTPPPEPPGVIEEGGR